MTAIIDYLAEQERLAEAAVAEGDQCIDQAMKRVEALEAERDAALAAVARVRAIHLNAGPSQGYALRFKGGYGMLGDCCAACGSHGEYGVEWPCPTIRAVEAALGGGGECS